MQTILFARPRHRLQVNGSGWSAVLDVLRQPHVRRQRRKREAMAEITNEQFNTALEAQEQQMAARFETQTREIRSVIRQDMGEIREVLQDNSDALNSHTRTLDGMSRQLLIWNTEHAAISGRLARHERWIQQLAKRMELKRDDV